MISFEEFLMQRNECRGQGTARDHDDTRSNLGAKHDPTPSGLTSMSNPATATAAQQLIERADVHKSCKAVEALVNLFNDYCEATSKLCGIQKKLYKALKETAAVKGTADVCGKLCSLLLQSSLRLF
jgi:hypothetical protein